MKVQKISQNNALKSQIRRSSVNMTGFGESLPRQSSPIDDKKASEAIKSNFLANVSFSGHSKNIDINHNIKYKYNTVRRPIYQGTSGSIIGYEEERVKDRVINEDYTAYSDRGSFKSKSMDGALIRAITMSSDYEGGQIRGGGKSVEWRNSYDTCPETVYGSAKVYFASKGEKLYKDDLKEHSYVVLPEGSYVSNYDNHWDEECDLRDDNLCGPDGLGWSWT